jgi:hypothetical protein
MARPGSESGLWAAVGVLGAIGLGIALIPLQAVTSASNLAFAFLVLTVVIAEIGGRTAALATAVVGALGLNFFLTAPYLTLSIDRPDDIVAFSALAVSGLVAAAFGRRRARSAEQAESTRRDLDGLARLGDGLLADDLRHAFGLGGIVLRAGDRLVAAAPASHGALPPPTATLERHTLTAIEALPVRYGSGGLRLPEGGGRVPLGTPSEPFSADLWEGDPAGLPADDCLAVGVALAMIELRVRPRYTGP